jgi:NAD(P)-dependent dehydrogenase (short-subunit alcohol dehydrogenase family)
MEFKSKNVIITGGSSGIGKASARIFATTGPNSLARREDILKKGSRGNILFCYRC